MADSDSDVEDDASDDVFRHLFSTWILSGCGESYGCVYFCVFPEKRLFSNLLSLHQVPNRKMSIDYMAFGHHNRATFKIKFRIKIDR